MILIIWIEQYILIIFYQINIKIFYLLYINNMVIVEFTQIIMLDYLRLSIEILKRENYFLWHGIVMNKKLFVMRSKFEFVVVTLE